MKRSLSFVTRLVGLCIFLVGKCAVSAGDTGSCRDGVGYKTDGEGWVTTVEYGSGCGEASEDLSRPGPGEAADQASPSGLDLLFWPLGFNDVADMWEQGPRVVRRGDPGYFARALNFTGESVEPVLRSAVAVNGSGSEPMKNGVGADGKDFRLVKRVRGKDGEWWSGGAPGETLDGSTIVGLIRSRGFTLVLNHLDFRHKGVAKSCPPSLGFRASRALFPLHDPLHLLCSLFPPSCPYVYVCLSPPCGLEPSRREWQNRQQWQDRHEIHPGIS